VRHEPLATQAETILARRLRSGEYRPGDQLPSEHDLAAELGVSRATVRVAISSLMRQGFVVGRQGVGNFVSEASRIANHLTDAIDFHDLIVNGGAAPSVDFDHAEIAAAWPAAATALRLDEGSLVHRAAKRFLADGEPVVMAITSIPVRVLDDALTVELVADASITEPLFDFFEQRVGRPTEYQLTSLRAVTGRDIAYPGHAVDDDVAVIEMEETGFANDNQPIWHSVNWYPPGAMQFELVRRRPPGAGPSGIS
jgi:GntR family transcriptional regulator